MISGAYKHVDGTSFAAPIVASIAAQMIEANPALTPPADQAHPRAAPRGASRASTVDRQGWGVVDAREGGPGRARRRSSGQKVRGALGAPLLTST